MRFRTIFAALLVAGLAATSLAAPPAIAKARATPTPSPAPLPPEDPAGTKAARQLFVTWQLGVIDRTKYTDELNALATDDQLQHTSVQLAGLGSLKTLDWLGYRHADGVPDGSKTYVYRANCANGAVLMQFSITPLGKIAGIIFRDSLTDF